MGLVVAVLAIIAGMLAMGAFTSIDVFPDE